MELGPNNHTLHGFSAPKVHTGTTSGTSGHSRQRGWYYELGVLSLGVLLYNLMAPDGGFQKLGAPRIDPNMRPQFLETLRLASSEFTRPAHWRRFKAEMETRMLRFQDLVYSCFIYNAAYATVVRIWLINSVRSK